MENVKVGVAFCDENRCQNDIGTSKGGFEILFKEDNWLLGVPLVGTLDLDRFEACSE